MEDGGLWDTVGELVVVLRVDVALLLEDPERAATPGESLPTTRSNKRARAGAGGNVTASSCTQGEGPIGKQRK